MAILQAPKQAAAISENIDPSWLHRKMKRTEATFVVTEMRDTQRLPIQNFSSPSLNGTNSEMVTSPPPELVNISNNGGSLHATPSLEARRLDNCPLYITTLVCFEWLAFFCHKESSN